MTERDADKLVLDESRMDFSRALDVLRAGLRVTRDGWNAHGMWLILIPGSTFTVETGRPIGIAAPGLVGQPMSYQPHIDMRTADGSVVPWIASQTDLLADDWRQIHIVPTPPVSSDQVQVKS
jgi:hypothetical protein